VDLYILSPIRLHGVVLNYLSTGITLTLSYSIKPFFHSSDDSARRVRLRSKIWPGDFRVDTPLLLDDVRNPHGRV
jgi:hypothetical protein